MTDIISGGLGGSTSGASATQVAQTQTEDVGTGVTGFDDFLTLLTAQLNNQDPLEPLDSTQFVEQLATFTNVEQQIATNDRLDQLISLQTDDAFLQLGQLVGQEVVATDPIFAFNGTALTLNVPEEEGATRAALVIRELDGTEVANIQVEPGEQVTFDGTETVDGVPARAGDYRAEFVFTVGEGANATSSTVPAQGEGRVVEARLNGSDVELRLDSDAIVRQANVVTVREPQPTDPT